MAKIPCPGSETYSHIFGVGRDGATPFAAFFRAFLVLLLEISTSRSLRRFLNKECQDPCNKVVSGPAFSKTSVRIVRKPTGQWHCVMGGDLVVKIDCIDVVPVAEGLSDKEMLEGVLAALREEENNPKGHGRA